MNPVVKYFDLETKLFEYFGCDLKGRKYPIYDHTNCSWMETKNNIWYTEEKFTQKTIESGYNLYSIELHNRYNQKDYVLVFGYDNGEKFYMLFRAKKECKDEGLKREIPSFW